eukprot:365701-Chlamydomonas_euryale.AAC.1
MPATCRSTDTEAFAPGSSSTPAGRNSTWGVAITPGVCTDCGTPLRDAAPLPRVPVAAGAGVPPSACAPPSPPPGRLVAAKDALGWGVADDVVPPPPGRLVAAKDAVGWGVADDVVPPPRPPVCAREGPAAHGVCTPSHRGCSVGIVSGLSWCSPTAVGGCSRTAAAPAESLGRPYRLWCCCCAATPAAPPASARSVPCSDIGSTVEAAVRGPVAPASEADARPTRGAREADVRPTRGAWCVASPAGRCPTMRASPYRVEVAAATGLVAASCAPFESVSRYRIRAIAAAGCCIASFVPGEPARACRKAATVNFATVAVGCGCAGAIAAAGWGRAGAFTAAGCGRMDAIATSGSAVAAAGCGRIDALASGSGNRLARGDRSLAVASTTPAAGRTCGAVCTRRR